MLFLITDFWIFNFEISSIVFEVIFLWLNFYNYMTLNKIVVGIEVALYALAVLIALSHFKRVFFDIESWAPMWMYLVQYLVVYPGGGLLVGFRLFAHFLQQQEYKTSKYNKSLKGRLYKQGQQKGQDMLKPIVRKRVNSILYDPSDEEEDYNAQLLKQQQDEEKKQAKLLAKQKKKEKKQVEEATPAEGEEKTAESKKNRFNNFKQNAKQKLNSKLTEINELYRQYQNEKNMRPEDKKLLKELIDDLNKDHQKKQTKKAFKFGALSKIKEDLQRKQQAKKERKRIKAQSTADNGLGLLEAPEQGKKPRVSALKLAKEKLNVKY